MDHAEYCGPLEQLRGKRALVQPDETYHFPLDRRTLRAQFDGNSDWRVGPKFKLKHPETGALLCVGWHTFPAAHFRLLIPVRV